MPTELAPIDLWIRRLVTPGLVRDGVRMRVAHGRVSALERAAAPSAGETALGTVVPGLGNAHSHAFHRLLRGRTHGDGGDFWQWRTAMYAAAARLTPEAYGRLAEAVFAEMLQAGYTAVGEFHYVHHRPGGLPYDPPHAMERALAHAARATGIRLTLLDTCYLTADVDGSALAPEQRRFGDADVDAWLARWLALRAALGASGDSPVTLGAAIHSVRAVPLSAIERIARQLPADVPLHLHVAEQPREVLAFRARHGVSPVVALAELGVIDARTTLVHGTHLDAADIALVGAAGATVAFCPTTEADLGDGIGPARALADAGARIALGSDQNAVIDPVLEIRGLEAGERLAARARGRFTPAELLAAGTANGYRSLGLGRHDLAPGDPADLVELDDASVRTLGSAPDQLVLSATAADVRRVFVGGRVPRAATELPEAAVLLARAMRGLQDAAPAAAAPTGAKREQA